MASSMVRLLHASRICGIAAGLLVGPTWIAGPAWGQEAPICKVAHVVALDQSIMFNRMGAHNPYGMIYALRHDVVDGDGKSEMAGGNLSPAMSRFARTSGRVRSSCA